MPPTNICAVSQGPMTGARLEHPERIAVSRLAIIHQERLKAELLNYYCTTHWGFEVVAVEYTGASGIAAIAQSKPDFVLVSLALPDVDAPEVIKRIHLASPATKIIGQTSYCSEYFLQQVGSAEYQGLFFDNDEGVAALGQTLDRARNGIRSISPRIIQEQARIRADPGAFPKLLSSRLQEVLVCIAHAMTDEEIARHLGVSRETALSHRKKIMGKLEIHSTPKLIRYCLEKGFTSAPLPLSAFASDHP
jgi:DNA-binding NarL/FixJ family response regulator